MYPKNDGTTIDMNVPVPIVAPTGALFIGRLENTIPQMTMIHERANTPNSATPAFLALGSFDSSSSCIIL